MNDELVFFDYDECSYCNAYPDEYLDEFEDEDLFEGEWFDCE